MTLAGPGHWKTMLRDRRGVAAVEFAIVFPVLLILCFGAFQLTMALTLFGKLNSVAGAVADIASRELHTSARELTGLENVARQFIEPYDVEQLRIVVSGAELDPNGDWIVKWSRALGGNARAKASPIPLSVSTDPASPKFVVVSELSYLYRPISNLVLSEPFAMEALTYRYPRVGGRVECPDC